MRGPPKDHREGDDFFGRILVSLVAQALIRLIVAIASRWPHDWP